MHLGSAIPSQFPGIEEQTVCFHDDSRARFLRIGFRSSPYYFRKMWQLQSKRPIFYIYVHNLYNN